MLRAYIKNQEIADQQWDQLQLKFACLMSNITNLLS
jgi:hypothetical protein